MSQDPNEAMLDERIQRIRRRNEEIHQRYLEVEADKQNADKFSMETETSSPEIKVVPKKTPTGRHKSAASEVFRQSNKQFKTVEKKYSNVFAQGTGPPPDPPFSFLADRQRDVKWTQPRGTGGSERTQFGGSEGTQFGGGEGTQFGDSERKQFGGSERKQFGGGERKQFGGGDRKQFGGSERKQFGGGERTHYRKGGDRYPYDSHRTSKDRGRGSYHRSDGHPEYDAWREERNRIDQERIHRQRTSEGSWRREWDNDKIKQEGGEEKPSAFRGRGGRWHRGQHFIPRSRGGMPNQPPRNPEHFIPRNNSQNANFSENERFPRGYGRGGPRGYRGRGGRREAQDPVASEDQKFDEQIMEELENAKLSTERSIVNVGKSIMISVANDAGENAAEKIVPVGAGGTARSRHNQRPLSCSSQSDEEREFQHPRGRRGVVRRRSQGGARHTSQRPSNFTKESPALETRPPLPPREAQEKDRQKRGRTVKSSESAGEDSWEDVTTSGTETDTQSSPVKNKDEGCSNTSDISNCDQQCVESESVELTTEQTYVDGETADEIVRGIIDTLVDEVTGEDAVNEHLGDEFCLADEQHLGDEEITECDVYHECAAEGTLDEVEYYHEGYENEDCAYNEEEGTAEIVAEDIDDSIPMETKGELSEDPASAVADETPSENRDAAPCTSSSSVQDAKMQ